MRLPKLVALLSLVSSAACVQSGEPDDVDLAESEVTAALERADGGVTTDDEQPSFGNPGLFAAAALETDAATTDALAADAELTAMRGSPTAVARRVLVAWGQLPPDRELERAKSWDGTFGVSRGGMLVRRLLGFEPRTDAVLPRTSRDQVSFTSMTKPFADGLVLTVVDPTPDQRAQTLSYRGEAGNYEFDLAALTARPQVIDVDREGNRLVAMSLGERSPSTDPCDHGFLRGRWHALRLGLGFYAGLVTNDEGVAIGHVRGIWGQRESGEKVMFGKFVNNRGQLMGRIVGRYDEGGFVARYFTRTGEAGRIQGVAQESAPGPRIGGAFMARWSETSCASDMP